MGRPSDYTPELADKLCEEIASGKSLRSICAADDMPACRTVFYWLAHRKDFLQQYAQAKQVQAEYMADEINELSDGALELALSCGDAKLASALVQAQKLRVDSRKWTASKLLPQKYGDRQHIEHSGELTLADRISKARAARDGSGG